MSLPWFFATTLAPHPPAPAPRRRRKPAARSSPIWWSRLGARVVAWGENAHHHRLGSWMQR